MRRTLLRCGAPWERLTRSGSGARGSLLTAMLVMMTIGSIMLAVASTEWSFIIRREKEKELIFRGTQIARALEEWQRQSGGAPPTTLEIMTKPPRPTLRKAYVDPMTVRFDSEGEIVEGTGEWIAIGPGDPPAPGVPGTRPPGGSAPAGASVRTIPTASSSRRFGDGPQIVPILGVHSSSEELSIGEHADSGPDVPYSEWKFRQIGNTGVDSAVVGGYELIRPGGFGGYRVPGAEPVRSPRTVIPQGNRNQNVPPR